MVITEQRLKSCRLCRRELPVSDFHRSRPGQFASQCKRCHSVAIRKCHFCNRFFVGKSGRKACSPLCSELLRSPTYLICNRCGQLFGPVSHIQTQILFESFCLQCGFNRQANHQKNNNESAEVHRVCFAITFKQGISGVRTHARNAVRRIAVLKGLILTMTNRFAFDGCAYLATDGGIKKNRKMRPTKICRALQIVKQYRTTS